MDTMLTVPANDEQVSNALDFEKNTPSTPEKQVSRLNLAKLYLDRGDTAPAKSEVDH